MAEAVVSFVVERVGDLLIQEVKFLQGVRSQVEQMQTELKRMQCFLKDADKKQGEDERVKGCISEIRELAYDAEDVIEIFAHEVASRSQPGFKNMCKRFATIFNKGAKLHKVGTEIETIKTRIADLTESLQKYGIKFKEESEASSSSVIKRQQMRRTYSHLVEEYTVGLERNTVILVNQLVTEEKQGQVISICGMGGLGKTTLANKAYHHDKVRRHFDSFAWACISQQFQARDVWEGILIKLVAPSTILIKLVAPSTSRREEISKMRDEEIAKELREEISKMRDEEIAKVLYQVQQEKKCLVILDDIWRVEDWEVLRKAFPIGKTTISKIVLTTRNKNLALHVNPNQRRILEPQCLTEEESWELLQKKAFFAKDHPDFEVNGEWEEIGRKMVRKCAGLPLAINVLGGILAQKDSFDEWTEVHQNIIFYLRRGNEGHEQEVSGIQSILGLSYHELPYRLKPCFLYIAHFPEDYEIPTKELFRMWVAEGFVQQQSNEVEENRTKEDIAELYLHELINRCMLQAGSMGSSGAVKTCRIHDLMRDLCLLKANEEKFLEIVRGYNQPISPRVHRVAMHGVSSCDPTYYSRAPKLRTLLFFTKDDVSELPSFKLLRMLTIDALNFHTREKEIGKLLHLRYLVIKRSWISSLPSSIGNLRFLQTLIVKSEFNIRIPNVIWKLEWLRHLNLHYEIESTTRGGKMRLGNLRYLQTLKIFDAQFFDVGELVNFTKLRNLSLVLQDMEELKVILEPPGLIFNHLTSLRIVVREKIRSPYLVLLISSCCPNLYKLHLRGKITKLPEHHQFPLNLTKLTLEYSELKEDPMTTLEKLPKLEYLCFKRFELACNEIVCSSKGFPRLKTLILEESSYSINYLEEWRVEEEAMPNLCQLHIITCSRLKMLPDGLRFITTLRELVIESMPQEFNKRLQAVNEEGEEGEDHYKVRHVPSIVFLN